MKRSIKIKLDKRKLYQIIEERNLLVTEVSTMLGYQEDYISNTFAPSSKNEMPLTSALAIAHILNVNLEDIEMDCTVEKNETVEETIVNDCTLVNDELSQIKSELAEIKNVLKELVAVYRMAWIDEVAHGTRENI